ncbi:hypothetical protein NOCA2480125 [metagenome]|uniref:DUF2510 domain-containing protein n=1 Tax=metagenome TaxID=256318 RepID=A0A2P2C818_9ZZZZ
MARKKWDYYKVAGGTPLTQSKKSAGAFRGLVHGAKGVKKQAEFFKVDKKRSFLGTLLAFAGKCLAAVVAMGAVIAIGALLVSAVANGVAAGLSDVGEAISAASGYLVIGAGVAALIAVAVVGMKIARSIARSRARASERAEARRMAAAEAISRVQQARPTQAAYGQQPTWTPQVTPNTHVSATPADWYPDPSNAAQFRYWNGAAWTNHERPRHATAATPAGWYPAPSDPSQLRYWNGTLWTDHFTPRSGALPAIQPATMPVSDAGRVPTGGEARISMSSAEWQNHVRAWMAAGAIERELWRRLSNAQINDADQLTLEAQRRMEQLTAEQGAQQIRLMLEANPGLGDELGLSEFLTYFLKNLAPLGRNEPVSIDRAGERRRTL